MVLVLGFWNWIGFDEDGGVGYVLSLTPWNLKCLSLLKIIYLLRNIFLGLSMEDSYDCCRNFMRIRKIETIFSFNCIEHHLTLLHGKCFSFWEKMCESGKYAMTRWNKLVKVVKSMHIHECQSRRQNICKMTIVVLV